MAFETVTNLFRADFEAVGRVGTFDDIVSGSESAVIEVPHWSWLEKHKAVRELLRDDVDDSGFVFVWPFVRDHFEHCHALITKNSFVITPLLPMVDLIPTFAECTRRIFMSATISDDSAIVRTFDAEAELVKQPIRSESLAGVSERMILLPQLMSFATGKDETLLRRVIEQVRKQFDAAVVILAPSTKVAESWKDVATHANTTEMVAKCVQQLQEGHSKGPFVFANRYDGIDLPNEACRVLIVSGLPSGQSEYDQLIATVSAGAIARNTALAQRIEQGMGRGARGAGDYCVVLIAGNDLNAWLGKTTNLPLLSNSTQAQLEMGLEVSKDINSHADLVETIARCLKRDKEWAEYHAEELAQLTDAPTVNEAELQRAAVERKAFRLMRDGYFEKAISVLQRHCGDVKATERVTRGWLLQFAARAAVMLGRSDLYNELQREAFALNGNISRPKIAPPYVHLHRPGKQAEAIVAGVLEYRPRRAVVAQLDEIASHLVPEASSNLFEQALADLGTLLGFNSERPEKKYGNGPDVLWRMNDDMSLVIEAKSRKNSDNALIKEEQGQLLVAGEWFKEHYPVSPYQLVVVHPSNLASDKVIRSTGKVLTMPKLQMIVAATRQLLTDLSDTVGNADNLTILCEKLLAKTGLAANLLTGQYLTSFVKS